MKRGVRYLIYCIVIIILILGIADVYEKKQLTRGEEHSIGDNSEKVSDGVSELKNIVSDKSYINDNIEDNGMNVGDIDLRNSNFNNKYENDIKEVTSFCTNNSIELIYSQPIEELISKVEHNQGMVNLLNELKRLGAKSVSYYTDNNWLNVELNITVIDETYSGIIYKCAEDNIDKNYEFENSKINEFRKNLTEEDNIDIAKVNSFIEKRINGSLESEKVFFNKINDNQYEVISVENKTVYYKLVYDPSN